MNRKQVGNIIAVLIVLAVLIATAYWSPARLPKLIASLLIVFTAIALDDLFCKFIATKFHSLKCIPLIRFMLALCVLGVSSLIIYLINPILSISLPFLIGLMIARIALQPCTKN